MTAPKPPLNASFARAVDLSSLASRTTASARTEGQPSTAASVDSPYVIDVSEATFQADVLERSLQVPVVLDLWAEWCGPCKQLSPVLERLASQANGAWILAKLDVDANPRITQALGVQGIPATKAIFQGQLVAEFTGALPEPDVVKWISSLLEAIGRPQPAMTPEQPPEDPRISSAEDAVAQGDFTNAARIYHEILQAEPNHPLAGAGLRQVELLQRVDAAQGDVRATADAEPNNVDAQLAAADIEVVDGNASKAFARLIATVRRSSGEERDKVRTRLVDLFEVVGDDDPAVVSARRDLARALF